MNGAHEFLRTIAVVLCVAAVTTVIFQRLRQPVVFGYLLAGLIVGPHIPIPLVADHGTIEALSELGIILVVFGLGIEFSLRRLIQAAPTAGLVAVIQTSAMVWFGYLVGQMFGWTTLECVYAGAVIAISSTTIIVKAFEEQGIGGKSTELVFGILLIEDLIAIFLLAIMTTIAAGSDVSSASLGATALFLAMFLALLFSGGMLFVPRLIKSLVRLNRPETLLVASLGICFAAALLARYRGYSVALGAFIAGSLIAESGEGKVVEKLVQPVTDMFAAVFFVSVGMMIDPALVILHWKAVLILTAVVIAGKLIAVSVGAFFTGHGIHDSVRTGMSLAQIGEFSFIIAGVGLATGAVGTFMYPVAVAVSAITTLTTPWLIRASGPVAAFVDRKLPRPVQTFVALYGSWIEGLRRAPGAVTERSRLRRRIGWMLADAAILAAIVIAASLRIGAWSSAVSQATGFSFAAARLMVLAGVLAVCTPLVIGLVRSARVIGLALARRAMPPTAAGMVDLAAAPRRALVATLQLALLFIVGIPLIAVTQPFLPSLGGPLVLLPVLSLFGIAFWRSATNLQGHARAGAEMILEALSHGVPSGPAALDIPQLAQLQPSLAGLGDPVCVQISDGCHAVDCTLAELNVRGLTGATVLAIKRADGQVALPSGHEALRAGDVLVLAGTQDAVSSASELLASGMPGAAGAVRS